MEQVRVALAWITKHHFWLLSALAVLLTTAVWYLAAGDLEKRKQDNLTKIKGAFSKQQQVSSRPYHANESFNNAQQEQIAALADETKQIWQELYDRQRKDVLVWPKQLPPGFLRDIEQKQFGDEIDRARCDQYTQYIARRYPDLPKIINANELDDKASGGGFGGGEFGGRGGGRGGFGGRGGGFGNLGARQEMEFDEQGNPIEVDYTVYWDEADQGRIKADLDWPTTQSYWRIWVTQEDLWVYETMLRAIAATNEAKGADRQSNAAITDIAALEVGSDAASQSRTSGRIKRLESGSSMMAGSDFGGDMESRGGGGFPGAMEGRMGGGDFGGLGGGADGAPGDAQEKALRLSGRYIDAEGKPIAVAPDEEPLLPDAFGQAMKQLPVRMVLRMDTRWLTQLTSELANADLQIKVTEIRVNPLNVEGGSGGGEFGGRSGGRGGGAFGGGFGSGNQEILAFDRKPYMKNVIIQGVVLIFNPPDEEVLNVAPDDVGADAYTSL